MKMVTLEQPDTGRAWVVALSACIINMILSGLSRMIGILYVAVIDTYGVTRQEATLPFTVRNGIRCLSGPVVGIIGQRFGIRAVTFVGGIIASAGAALCCIAPNITWLAVFWGGIHGFGFALANTLFQVVVNQYFKKYRATASGIALSGACVGSLAFPFMLEAILDTFGLYGGFLILGGIVMNVLPPSLLLTVPQWVKYPKAYARLWALKNAGQSVETVESVVVEEDDEEESVDNDDFFKMNLPRTTSLSNDPVESVEVCKASKQDMERERRNSVFPSNATKARTGSECNVICTRYRIKESPKSEKKSTMSTQNVKNSLRNGHSGSGKTASIYSISEALAVKEKEAHPEDMEISPPVTKESSGNASTQSFSESLKTIAKLYTNPVYVLISVCMSTYIIIFIPILTVLVDYSNDKGLPSSSGKYLINAMAIGDLIGRLGFGWVTDKKLMTIPVFMTLVLVLQGIFIALFPFAMSLSSFMVLLILYGMAAGSILVLFPVLVLQYVDTNEQAVAMACVGFLSGIMSFAIPPMIGHFRDQVGSYDGMFYLTGVVSVVSGGFWLLEPIAVKYYYGNQGEKVGEKNSENVGLKKDDKIEQKNSTDEEQSSRS